MWIGYSLNVYVDVEKEVIMMSKEKYKSTLEEQQKKKETVKKKKRPYKERSNMKPLGYSLIKAEDINTEGAGKLIAAIFDTARRDYIYDRGNEVDRNTIIPFLNIVCKEPDMKHTIIKNWNEQKDYVMWRRRMHCSKCKKKNGECIHRGDDTHYTKPRICVAKEENRRRKLKNVEQAI